MGQYARHVFVCTSGDDRPAQGHVESFVRTLRAEGLKAGLSRARSGSTRLAAFRSAATAP